MSDPAELSKPPPVVWASSRVPPPVAFGVAMVVAAIAILPFPLFFTDALRAAAFLLVVLAAIPVRVRIGPEAMSFSWIGRSTMVRYDNIVRASPLNKDVIILLKGGGVVRLLPSILGGPPPQRLLTQLWDTLSAGAESGVRTAERARLSRGKRSAKEWVEELRSLTLPGQQYRQNIDHERLWTLVANPAVETEIRVGAAIALAAVFDNAARDRLRAIARETVDERLQRTLEVLADAEDIAALERAADKR